MITIVLKEITPETTTNQDGDTLFSAVDNLMSKNKMIVMDLTGISPMSSSFLSSSVGKLLDKYGYDTLREKIKLTNYKKRDAAIIKDCIDRLVLVT